MASGSVTRRQRARAPLELGTKRELSDTRELLREPVNRETDNVVVIAVNPRHEARPNPLDAVGPGFIRWLARADVGT